VGIEQNCDIETVWEGVCNDVLQIPSCPSINWSLQKGKLSFKVSKVTNGSHCSEEYLATVILENASFKNDNGEVQTFDLIEFTNVQVGWCAG